MRKYICLIVNMEYENVSRSKLKLKGVSDHKIKK